jgi:hypothetical protein
MPIAMTMIQTKMRRRKRDQSQRLQDQDVQVTVDRYGSSSLAQALAARLRRKRALALRQPHRAVRSVFIRNRSYTPHLRIQKDAKQVKHMLNAIVQGSEAERWLAAPNAMLGGARPVDKIRQGKTRQVIELLTIVQESIHV